MTECLEFLGCANLDPSDKSRAFALWLFSINHGQEAHSPVSLAEKLTSPAAVITGRHELEAVCKEIWIHYFPSVNLGVQSENWTGTLHLEKDLVRSQFVNRFLADQEVEAIWTQFVGKDEFCSVAKLKAILKALHRLSFANQTEGDWIIQEWLVDILALCPSQPFIDQPSFKSAFPVWYAAIAPNTDFVTPAHLASVWPDHLDDKTVYSRDILATLLRDAWSQTIPPSLSLPCQTWWVDRCSERLLKVAPSGVSRADFCSIFPTPREMNVLAFLYKNLGTTALYELLYNVSRTSSLVPVALVEAKEALLPVNFIEEFFLIAKMDTSYTSKQFNIPRNTFTYSLALWWAAHYKD